jgi:undecaprenyl-diphosphatase
MNHLIDRLLGFPPGWALVLVFLVPAAEASLFAGFIFPGEIAILLGGVLANEGKLPLWAVIVVGTLGASFGDSIGYEVGRHYGTRLLDKIPRRLVKPEHVLRTQELLRTKGGRAVFIGRFTAALRVLVPGMAGVSRLPYRRFLFFNVTGAIAWVTETALVGYIVGRSYKSAEHRLSLISLGILALLLLFLAFRYLRRSKRAQDWLHRNFDWARRLDRTLILLSALSIGGVWLFAGLTQDVVAREGLAGSDLRILRDVISHRSGILTHLAKAVTTLGLSSVLYTVIAITGLLVFRSHRSWRPLLLALGVMISGQLVRLVINETIARARPPEQLWLAHPAGHAYPSGHTTTATLGYGIAAALLIAYRRNLRAVAISIAALLAAAVGLSRVYLGVHWPTDVLGGWLLGLTWLALAATVLSIQRLLRRRRSSSIPADPEVAA